MNESTPAERLRADLMRIAGERHLLASRPHHDAVADLVRDRWRELGWETEEQPVAGPLGIGRNIIATRRGERQPERFWLVGAHYDTVRGTPGADDNGIAVAALLELARLFQELRFRDSVQLVAWDQEEVQTPEVGGLVGSRLSARQARGRQDIGGVIVLEMIGLCRREPDTQRFPPGFGWLFPRTVYRVRRRGFRGDFLTALANGRSRNLLDAVERSAATAGLPFIPVLIGGVARLLPDFYRSDHAPYWSAGFPAVMLTDTANFRNGFYHTRHDTVETIDFEFASQVVQTVSLTIRELAGELAG